jgi:hypothetical protein
VQHLPHDESRLTPYELRCCRRLLTKLAVLEGMIDEYERQERRGLVFRELFSDARSAALFVAAVGTVVLQAYAIFAH